ncbi:transcription termination factor NusA [Candidatus Riflebacteria bacterium]
MNFLQTLEEVSKTKNVSPETLMNSIRKAVAIAYKKKYGQDCDLRVDFDSKDGTLQLWLNKKCVSRVQNPQQEITISKAKKIKKDVQPGDVVEEKVDTRDFGRIAVKVIKQIVSQNIAEEERESQFDEIFKREKCITIGRVQRVENKKQGTVFLEIGKNEVALPHKSQIPGESFSIGDRVRVFVLEVKKRAKSAQVTISRTCAEFLQKLFEDEIPEIQEGIVKIHSVAREAGSRTKIAIFSDDSSIDPVGACVGIRGSRILGIVEELNGEKLDIIKYHPNLKEFIINALSPAKVSEVRFNEDNTVAEVFVPKSQISLAIGSGGQNVRLAAKLVNCHLDLKTDD